MTTADPAGFELAHLGLLHGGQEVMDDQDGGTVRQVDHVDTWRRLELEPTEGEPDHVDVLITDRRAYEPTFGTRRITARRWWARVHYVPLAGHPDHRDGWTGDKLLTRPGPSRPGLTHQQWDLIEQSWEDRDTRMSERHA